MQQCIFFFRFDLGCWVGLTRWKDYLVLEIRSTVEQNAARSHATYRLLKKQRRALRSLNGLVDLVLAHDAAATTRA